MRTPSSSARTRAGVDADAADLDGTFNALGLLCRGMAQAGEEPQQKTGKPIDSRRASAMSASTTMPAMPYSWALRRVNSPVMAWRGSLPVATTSTSPGCATVPPHGGVEVAPSRR